MQMYLKPKAIEYLSRLFLSLIFQFGCSNKESEKDKLNQKDPLGLYGVSLSDTKAIDIGALLRSADEYVGGQVMIKGSIIEVCPMRGCWIQAQDKNTLSSIRIKVTDGEIVFPLSAIGLEILAEG